MAKPKQTTTKAAVSTKTQHATLYRVPKVLVSERKLDPHITIGFAKKAPKFVVEGRNTVVYEK